MGKTLAELRRDLQDAKDSYDHAEVKRLTETIKLRERQQMDADFEETSKWLGLSS